MTPQVEKNFKKALFKDHKGIVWRAPLCVWPAKANSVVRHACTQQRAILSCHLSGGVAHMQNYLSREGEWAQGNHRHCNTVLQQVRPPHNCRVTGAISSAKSATDAEHFLSCSMLLASNESNLPESAHSGAWLGSVRNKTWLKQRAAQQRGNCQMPVV